MTFGLGHVGAIDETVASKTEDPIEHLPKLHFESKVLLEKNMRTAVVRPGFVYGIPIFIIIEISNFKSNSNQFPRWTRRTYC